MGDAAVGDQIADRVQPKRSNKIDVWNTLKQRTIKHGALSNLFPCNQVTDTGTKNNMR